MELFKKKTLKFVNERISREFRHAETLKARESSRFKRLSIIRSMGDSIANDSVDAVEENLDVCQETRNDQKSTKETSCTPKKPSRLEMLKKWKQEKLMKKEIEKKTLKKPFYYAGSNSGNKLSSLQFRNPALESSQNLKSSYINQSRCNVSRTVNSKFLPKPTFQAPKVPTNNSKLTTCAVKSKATSIPTFGKKENNVAAKSGSIVSNKGSFARPAIGGVKPPSSKATPTESSASKIATSQGSFARPAIGKIKPVSSRGTPTESSSKIATSQGLAFSRSISSKSLVKPTQKVDSTISKAVSAVPNKFSKGIPIKPPKQIATTSINTRIGTLRAPNKAVSKGPESGQNITIRKRIPEKLTSSGVKQGKSAHNTKEAKDEKVPCSPAPVENRYNIPFLETPDFNQIKKIFEAKFKNEQREKQNEDNEGISSPSVVPAISENRCEKKINKSLIKEDTDEQIKNVSLQDGVCEEKLSAQTNMNEANDVKVSYDSPTKSPSKDVLSPSKDVLGTQNIVETKMKPEEIQDGDNIIKHDLFEMPETIEQETESVTEELLYGQSVESIPDLTLNCDLSVIKSEMSFAPFNFKFQAPIGVNAFLFDDTSEATEIKNLKFMSRTSTPTRGKSSDPISKTQKSSPGKDFPLINKIDSVQETSNDLPNEIIDNPFKMVLHNEDLLISETPDILVNDETFEEEEELIIKKDVKEKSPEKFLVKEDVEEKFNVDPDINKANNEEVFSEHSVDKMSTNNQAEESGIALPESQSQSVKLIVNETPDILVNDDIFEEEEKLIIKKGVKEKSPEKFLVREDVEEKFNVEPDINEEVFLEHTVDKMCTNNQSESQSQSVKLTVSEQEKQGKGDIPTEKVIAITKGKKSRGAISKKHSIHRKSVLHSIVETSETEELISPVKTVKSQNSPCTPRRSLRLSTQKSQALDDPSTIKEEAISITPVAPQRRSQRLLQSIPKLCQFDDVLSPFKGKKSTFNLTPRRSMRLIDLSVDNDEIVNTPENGNLKTNLTADFQKLELNSNENTDPNSFLIDFENSPDPILSVNSRKISLLYSPEKRKSIRKSIRGDLMSFSPNN